MPQDHLQAKRRTTRGVYLWDRVATATITVGGVGVLAAVLAICVYLLWTVLPLFRSGSVSPLSTAVLPPAERVAVVLGEYGQALGTLDRDGTLRAAAVGTGEVFHEESLFPGRKVTAAAWTPHGHAAVALDDGSLYLGTIELQTSPASKPAGAGDETRAVVVRSGEVPGRLLERVWDDQWRATSVVAKLEEKEPPSESPIRRLDLCDSGTGEQFLVVVREDLSAQLGAIETITPLSGDEPTQEFAAWDFRLANPEQGVPDWVFITGDGAHVYALWKSGAFERYARQGDEVRLAESASLVQQPRTVTAAGMLLGGLTLLVGDDEGGVRAYQPARDVTSPAFDSVRLVQSSSFSAGEGAVVSLAASPRERVIAAATQRGDVVLRHMTSRKEVARLRAEAAGSSPTLAINQKGDTLTAVDVQSRLHAWSIAPGHADASFAALFLPLRYEGEAEPRFVYQSSAGSESAELKLSLVPLIFGTLKATVVAMLIAVPLAVLGAVYTSEFMHPSLRRVVKPTVELMASLPSVVLGFIAAMVVAPVMARNLPQVLIAAIVAPVMLGLFAHLWQLVPRHAAVRVTRRVRVVLVGAALAVSIIVGVAAAGPAERVLFAPNRTDLLLAAGSYEPLPREQWPAWVGRRATMSPDEERHLRREGMAFRAGGVVRVVETDQALAADAAGEPSIRRWLDGSIGGAFPGWLVALAIPVLVATFLLQGRYVNREWFERYLGNSPGAMAVAELGRYLLTLVVGGVFTAGLAWALTRVGLDPRDSVFGPFSQRNTLVVGAIMGFAVIPIIYTISEDALRSVPNHLRSASLGVGATPWQTAVRVVLPTAASGVFSATMIGLGRAVGETMIVLMATGNTPEITPNIFSGLRTLSANIAVELPEAVRGGTHYRVLFLCGLVLFVLTFIVNTTAEVVRQRFRKRNAAL